MQSLIVILDQHAVAFCHYDNPTAGAPRPRWMGLDVLQAAVRFAQEKGLSLIYLLGRHPLPKAHVRAIARTEHTQVVPFAAYRGGRDAVPVLEAVDVPAAARIRAGGDGNAILRVGRSAVPQLASTVARLAGRFKRLNICLADLAAYAQADIEAYRQQLDELVGIVSKLSQTNGGLECSILTDRLLLREMRNCAAGIEHVTVAPNGRFYLCPGFYYRDEADTIGCLQDGLHIRNAQLLTADHAPICRRCDAYHCRRCLLLNKGLTDEINTPSWEQCVTAHHEREASRALLGLLRQRGRVVGALQTGDIPPLNYCDPFELVRLTGGQPARQGADDSGSPGQKALGDGPVMEEVNTLRQMVLELRASQQQILQEISQLRKERLREEQETK